MIIMVGILPPGSKKSVGSLSERLLAKTTMSQKGSERDTWKWHDLRNPKANPPWHTTSNKPIAPNSAKIFSPIRDLEFE